MPPPEYPEMSKAQLLAAIRAEREEWQALVDQVGDRWLEPGVAGDWSIKDVVAHLCSHQRWLLGELGGTVRIIPPAPDHVNMFDLDERNAWLHSLDSTRSLEDVSREAEDVYAQLLELAQGRSEPELKARFTVNRSGHLAAVIRTDVPHPPWALWRWIVSVTVDHYRYHTRLLRRWLVRSPEVRPATH